MNFKIVLRRMEAKLRRSLWIYICLWTVGFGLLSFGVILFAGKLTLWTSSTSFGGGRETVLLGILSLFWIFGFLVWIVMHAQIKRYTLKRLSLIEKLNITNSRLRFWADSVSEGLFIFDGESIIVANLPFAKMTGSSQNELIGESIWQLLAPEHHDLIREHFRKQHEFEIDTAIIQKDGASLPVKMQIKMKNHPRQNKKIWIVFVQNLAEIRKVQIAVKENERKLSTLISNLPGMAYRCKNDPLWTMEYISDVCEKITGYPSDELIENRKIAYGDLIHPDDRKLVDQTIQQSIQNKTSFETVYRITTASQKEKWLWEKGRGVYDAEGEFIALEGFILDISERKSLEEQFYQAQKMESIGRLAGGIAHDFNNLLTVIIGYCNISLMKLKENDPLYKNCKEIFRAADQAASITSQLLAFSRKQVIQLKILNLNVVLSDMERMLQRLIGEDIELETSLDPRLWRIKSDLSQIQQIIINLAVNARDAMPTGGHIMIQTYNFYGSRSISRLDNENSKSLKDDYVVITFSDTGCGIDPKIINQIFEPMFTTKDPGKGTGLGLSTVYGIVKQNKGRIEVQSAPGQGSLFRLFFPAVMEETNEDDRVVVHPAAPAQYHSGSETILVIDDNPTIRLLIKKILDDSNYTVLEAPNEESALHISRETPSIHLLITDLVMPKMNGTILANQIKSIHPLIKVLFISGYDEDALESFEEQDNRIAFLAKPFNADSLREKIQDILNTP